MASYFVACRTKDGTKGLWRIEDVEDFEHAREFITQEDPDLQTCLILVANNKTKVVSGPRDVA